MKIESLMVQPLFKSSIPLLFGGSYHLLKATISRFFQNTPTGDNFLQLHGMKQNLLGDQDSTASCEGLILDILNLLNQVSFGIYSNLFAFLFTMLLIDLFIKIAQNGIQEFWKEVQSSRISLSINRAKEWRLLNLISESQIRRIFSYAVIFMLLHIIGFGLSFTQSEIFPSQPAMTFSQLQTKGQEEYFDLSRILEEEEVGNEQQSLSSSMAMTSDKMSLSMGNTLSSLSINVNAMVLSKDKKIAFVTIDFYGTLQIIDLSDLHSPFIMGSLSLEISTFEYRIKSLALSSDEKTLYISNSKDLEIVNVADPSSPKLISRTKSEVFGFYESTSDHYKTSLAVSEMTNTLYIGGLGLQVYDISDLKKPVLLKALRNDVNEEFKLTRNEICLSRDGKILFIANGTLDVHNVSDPKEMKLLYSLETESSPRSIFLSEDFKTAFLLGTDEYSEKVIFQEMDIGSLEIKSTVNLGHRSRNSPRFLAISPSKSKFFILANSDTPGVDLLIFDRLKQTTIKNEKSLIEDTFTMDFALDGKTLITGSKGQFMMIELFLDYPNTQRFSRSQDNLIKSIPLPTSCTQMKISSDGQYLFIVREGNDENGNAHIFEIWDLKNSTKPTILSSYNCGQSIGQMHLANNYETVYLLNPESIFVLDIKNRSSIDLKKTFKSTKSHQNFDYFVTLSDEKTGFLVIVKENIGYVTFIDLSQPSGVIESSVELRMESTVFKSKLILKDNDKTLIVINKEISIYNISNLLAPVQIASMPFGINEPETYLSSHLLSPDSKTLFLETFDQSGFVKLRIYNISDPTSPQILSEKFFSKNEEKFNEPGFQLSLDLKNGFVFQENHLIKLNLTNLKKPEISGIIPLNWNKSNKISAFLLSPDSQTIYASVGSEIHCVNMNIQYTLFLKQEKFMLGEKYSDTVMILNFTGSSSSPDYNLVDTESYKIIKMSLMDIKVAPNQANLEMKTSLLPSWMTFDRENNLLTVESKKQRDIGTYTLCSNFSLKIPHEVFENLGTAEHPILSEDLVAWLISLDYVDPQLYLTANFRSFDTFYLPSNFSLYRKDIYNILKMYHVETCTLFEVVSSLKVEETKISTLSTSNIKVEVKLEPQNGSDAKFVNRPYGSLLPTMKDNKTKISLEGNLKEINTALNSIIVNFENGTESDANVVIIDGLNAQVSKSVNNISKYFRANRAPYLNKKAEKTIQEQIDSANIQTGVYFTLALSEDSFKDDFAESLNYELKMAKNNTAFPTWLNFNGLTLKGNPPEDIFGRDIDLVLIAKNEFKHSGVPVKLHIKISAVFWLKLLVRYSPYILSLIGLLVSANKIFNILRKGFYKHPKEFYVGVGEEISNNVIFPVSFIKEEQKQSQMIMKYMRNVVLADFMNSSQQRIDKDKVISAIKETIQKMSVNMKKQITLYPNPIIDQIIINKFVWMQLDRREEMKTKRLFEDLKKANCLEVVERDVSGFAMNQNKLNKLIKQTQKPSIESNESFTLEESLISHEFDYPGVNIHLLKDAILTFAFENYSLDVSPVDVDIGVKQKVPKSCLFRFLKLDLKDIYLDYKNKINYGLNYQIIGDKLSFYGMAQDNLKGKTLVIQIKNRKHRIMKEIWINGVSNDFQKDQSFMIKDEQEMRGQGYEIY